MDLHPLTNGIRGIGAFPHWIYIYRESLDGTYVDLANQHGDFSQTRGYFMGMYGHYINLMFGQWEFQDPKMEVLYHIRPYFVGIFPYIGLTLYMVGTSNLGS